MATETSTTETSTSATEQTPATTENGNGKRAYTRKPKEPQLQFTTAELYALRAILDGDKTVNGAWNEHLMARIAPFIPTVPDLAQPPTKFLDPS